MTIRAEIVEDSVAQHEFGDRLTSFSLYYPRYILAELNTHRVFSRSSASSRAIPTKTMIERIVKDTARPVSWGKNQRGMQAGEELDTYLKLPEYVNFERVDQWNGQVFHKLPEGHYRKVDVEMSREHAWDIARDNAITVATAFDAAGYHKQVVNRILEPFTHVATIVTATEWDNWFELRSHKDADPTAKALSDAMLEAYEASKPRVLKVGQWHLPWIKPEERDQYPVTALKKMSTARSARVSYFNHDGTNPNVAKDLSLYDDLVGARPLHASPAEHQGTPDEFLGIDVLKDDFGSYDKVRYKNERMHGNFKGFIQHRKILELDVFK